MDITKLLRVLEICIPVFFLIGIGKFLDFKRIMNSDNRVFINKIVYNICIPGLILYNTVKQPFSRILNLPLIVSCYGAIIIVIIIFSALSQILKVSPAVKAGFIIGVFWANTAYMGFPLSSAAFGAEEGFLHATVINAFINPVFVIAGVFILSAFIKKKNARITDIVKGAVLNPIVVSSLIGILISLLTDIFSDRSGLPQYLVYPAGIIGEILKLAGSMGLPLALIAIGGALNPGYLFKSKGLLIISAVGKLLVIPLSTLLILKFLFPQTAPTEAGVAVLIMAMPVAVSTFVVYRQLGGEEGFMSSLLVVSTVLSIITIPVWLYFII